MSPQSHKHIAEKFNHPFSGLTFFCFPFQYFKFSSHRKEDPKVEAAYGGERKNSDHGHSQPVVVVGDVGLCLESNVRIKDEEQRSKICND